MTGPAIFRHLVRLAVILALAYGVHLLIAAAGSLEPLAGRGGGYRDLAVGLLLIVYVILIAVPFVPGVEVGLALMAMEGPWIAPVIYAATMLGLLLAFGAGRWLPPAQIDRLLADLHLRRARALHAEIASLDPPERLALLNDRAPGWLRPLVLRFRYLLIAVLVNLPGNSLLGGGGGILLIAGLSRLFRPLAMTLTLMLAVLPVPLLVWAFNINILH